MCTRLLTGLLVASFSAMSVACGDTVVGTPGSGGVGGGATTSTTSAGSTASTGSTGEGGGAALCGGFAGAECNGDAYCDFAGGLCGGDDSQGVCLPRPDGCTKDCPGVCGCDGQFYCNDCSAAMAGVDVGANTSCSNGGGEYSAYFWPGGLDHIIVHKADSDAGRCFMIFADWPTENAPGFDFVVPDGWGVSHAIVTDQAADCAAPFGQVMGQAVDAIGGAGEIRWEVAQGMYAPCTLDVEASVSFTMAPPWVPPTEFFGATDVSVEGGCM